MEHRALSAEPSEISLFREFVREKKYQTEAEMFGWSFILRTLSPMSLETKQLSR